MLLTTPEYGLSSPDTPIAIIVPEKLIAPLMLLNPLALSVFKGGRMSRSVACHCMASVADKS
ncbi:hypothetical protein JCM19238_3481 [Vibrio ponticus]|nr:hypothetical protein JCM19238_3481 [Vibrio ponticus]